MHPKTPRWFVASLVCVILASGLASAEVILPSVPEGSRYQLVFVTRTTGNAWSGSFNSIVRNEAALSAFLPETTWWSVTSVGSTAQSNAKVYPDVPIYNTAGQLVASNGAEFYSSAHQASIGFDQYGNANNTQVWTGIYPDGQPVSLASLYAGNPAAAYGTSYSTTASWAYSGLSYNNVEYKSFYALSEPIVAVPEPSTLIPACIAAIGWACNNRRRRSARPRSGTARL